MNISLEEQISYQKTQCANGRTDIDSLTEYLKRRAILTTLEAVRDEQKPKAEIIYTTSALRREYERLR